MLYAFFLLRNVIFVVGLNMFELAKPCVNRLHKWYLASKHLLVIFPSYQFLAKNYFSNKRYKKITNLFCLNITKYTYDLILSLHLNSSLNFTFPIKHFFKPSTYIHSVRKKLINILDFVKRTRERYAFITYPLGDLCTRNWGTVTEPIDWFFLKSFIKDNKKLVLVLERRVDP